MSAPLNKNSENSLKKAGLEILFGDFPAEPKGINAPMIIAIAVIIILSLVPFIKNYKYHDNHLNWLNHDYPKNLMISTEENSIYMTEGGDNQVFGTLYFTYAEKLRPDLTPYDQKGNIFKRIYGDMRYAYPEALNMVMNIVDSNLFISEEPFHKLINKDNRAFLPRYENGVWLVPSYRGMNELSFIPYWQGQRPVYLTWERPNPGSLGDYYYKRYGIMYKVQDIAYFLVDYLEIKKEITLENARAELSSRLGRTVDMAFTIKKISQMQKEGYLRLAGNTVQYVKMYEPPHKGGYFEKFALRWKDVPNAIYWDFLSREIIVNYDYQMGEVYREKVKELQEIRKTESRPSILADIDKRIKDNWILAKQYYEDALYYGADGLGNLHNIAVVYIRNDIENLDSRGHELLARAVKLYPESWSSYSVLFSFLLADILKNPQNETGNVKEIESLLSQVKKNMVHFSSTGGDYTKHENWKYFVGIEAFLNNLKQLPIAQFNAMDEMFSKQLKENPRSIDNNMAQQIITILYSRGVPLQYEPYIKKADAYFNQLIALKSSDPVFLNWAFSTVAIPLQRYSLAYQIGKNLERLGTKQEATFYYMMGMITYQQNNKGESKVYMKRFLDGIKDDRQALFQYKEAVENAKKIVGE